MKNLIAAVTCVFCFIISTLLAASEKDQSQNAHRPKWEYKIASYFDLQDIAKQHGQKESLENGLNALGSEGWELVGFEPRVLDPLRLNGQGSTSDRLVTLNAPVYYFKRQTG